MKIKLKHRIYAVPAEELINELKRVAKIYRRKTISISEYQRYGRFNVAIYFRRLGGWIKSLEMAGLSSPYERNAPFKKLLENLEDVFVKLGRQPRSDEMRRNISRYSVDVYQARFGSWGNTLKIFEEYLNLPKQNNPGRFKDKIEELLKKNLPRRNRRPSLRMRLDILERDRFRCRFCRRSPATHPAIWLEIDHDKPFSQNGKTEFDNLQTLCNECNQAKGSRRIKV